MREAVIAGVGMTQFGKFLERNLKSLCEEAVREALGDAGVAPAQIECVFFANAAAGVVTGQEMIRAQSALRKTGLAGKPMFNIENACASSSSALHLARASVASGQYECVLVVGAEKLSHEDKKVSFGAFAGGVDREEDLGAHVGSGTGSVFMDLYAAKTRKWMKDSGVTGQDIARVCLKSRHAGSLNPAAQFRQTTTIEEVLASRMVSDPLTLFMCSSIGDGAAAIVVCSPARARELGATPVHIKACSVVSAPGVPGAELVAVTAARPASS